MADGASTLGVVAVAMANDAVDIALAYPDLATGSGNIAVVSGDSLEDEVVSMAVPLATVTGAGVFFRGRVPNVAGQVLRLDEIRFPEDDCPLDHILQLAHVAWPAVAHQDFLRF